LLNELRSDGKIKLRSFEHAVRICEENAWDLEPDSEEFEVLCEQLRRAERQAVSDILQRARSDEFVPSYEQSVLENRESDRRYTITHAVRDYAKRNPSQIDMIKKLDLALMAWRQIIGKESFVAIDGRDVIDFIEAMETVPKNAGVRFPGLTLPDAALANAKLEDPYPILTAKSIKVSYVGVLTTAANVALERKRIGRNPFLGNRVKGSRKKAQHRRAFRADELHRIFRHPVFTGCASAKRRYSTGDLIVKDSLYWSPLIALFTGLRASEIGALEPSDLKLLRGHDGANWYISVRGTKSENAVRDIPLHGGIVELGLIDLFKTAEQNGNRRVFEEWKKPKNKKFSEARVIRNFNEKICSSIGEAGSRPGFHCFRHSLQARMARSGLDPKFQRAILGHSQKGMEADYYKKDIRDYAQAFCRLVKFDDLDIRHLYEEK